MDVYLQPGNSAFRLSSLASLLNFTFTGSLRSGDLPQQQHIAISHQCCPNNAILHTLAVLQYETSLLQSKILQLFFFSWEIVTTNSQTVNSALTM